MGLQVLYQTQGILQVVEVDQVRLIEVRVEILVLEVQVVELLEVLVLLQQLINKEEQILVEVVELQVVHLEKWVVVVQELLLLDINFKINMYLLNLKINI